LLVDDIYKKKWFINVAVFGKKGVSVRWSTWTRDTYWVDFFGVWFGHSGFSGGGERVLSAIE